MDFSEFETARGGIWRICAVIDHATKYCLAATVTPTSRGQVSDTLTADDTGPWRDQTTIVRRADSHEAVARLREQDGDALIFGSQTLWTDLLAHGLVDELHLMIGPKIVAGDHRAFDGVAETDLRLIGVRTWGGSDNVVLSYGLGGSPR